MLTLATAVPKGERFDWLVEKATELGVARLVPVLAERSVVDPRAAKLDRLRRAIVESSKQCRRNRLMDLDAADAWASLVGSGSTARPPDRPSWRAGDRRPGLRLDGQAVILAIGPEGGFTSSEVDHAIGEGWRVVGLGATLLRVETAALAASAILLALADGDESEINQGKGA